MSESRKVVPCEKCHKKIRLPEKHEGIKLRCPACKHEFLGRFDYINVRVEWIVWQLLGGLDADLEKLKSIVQAADGQWGPSRESVLHETMLWSLAGAAAVLRDKLSDEYRKDVLDQFAMFLDILFPEHDPYKNLYLISIYADLWTRKKDQRQDIDWFLDRVSRILELDAPNLKQQPIREGIMMHFPNGWMTGIDAFWPGMEKPPIGLEGFGKKFSLEHAKAFNEQSRIRFQKRIRKSLEHAEKNESPHRRRRKERWFTEIGQLTEAVGQLRREVEKELEHREGEKEKLADGLINFLRSVPPANDLRAELEKWMASEKLDLSAEDRENLLGRVIGMELDRRKEAQTAVQAFLSSMNIEQDYGKQVLPWVEKNMARLVLSESEVEELVEKASARYNELVNALPEEEKNTQKLADLVTRLPPGQDARAAMENAISTAGLSDEQREQFLSTISDLQSKYKQELDQEKAAREGLADELIEFLVQVPAGNDLRAELEKWISSQGDKMPLSSENREKLISSAIETEMKRRKEVQAGMRDFLRHMVGDQDYGDQISLWMEQTKGRFFLSESEIDEVIQLSKARHEKLQHGN